MFYGKLMLPSVNLRQNASFNCFEHEAKFILVIYYIFKILSCYFFVISTSLSCKVNLGFYQTVIGRSSGSCQSSWRFQVKYLLGSNLLVVTRQELRSQEAEKGLRINFRYVFILVVLSERISVLLMKDICETFRLHLR